MIKRLLMSLRLLTCYRCIQSKKTLRPPQALHATNNRIELDTRYEIQSITGNRLVLILKVVEPQKYLPKAMRLTTEAPM